MSILARASHTVAAPAVALAAVLLLSGCGTGEAAPAAAPPAPVTVDEATRPPATAAPTQSAAPQQSAAPSTPRASVAPKTPGKSKAATGPTFPKGVPAVQGKKQWIAVVVADADGASQKIRTAESRMRALGYDFSTGQCIPKIEEALGAEVLPYEAHEEQWTYVTTQFTDWKAALKFAEAYEKKYGTSTLGAVYLAQYCLD